MRFCGQLQRASDFRNDLAQRLNNLSSEIIGDFVQEIIHLLSNFDPDQPTFPPTEIFNEGWLLRLVLSWFSRQDYLEHPLAFEKSSRWFSEALLPSPFLPRFRGDPLAEARTHADGAIGHFEIGKAGKVDLELSPSASQFIVVEAKINSSLSPGTRNAPDYDQAARSVACIAEVLRRANLSSRGFDRVGFYVLAPASKLQRGNFGSLLDPISIRTKVKARLVSYDSQHDEWFEEWFQPVMDVIKIDQLSWEEIIQWIGEKDQAFADAMQKFYAKCLTFN